MLKHLKILAFFGLLCLINIGCKPKKEVSTPEIELEISPGENKVTETNPGSYEEISVQRYNNRALYKFNESKEYVICYTLNKTTSEMPFNGLRFFIYDIPKNEIIYEDKLYDGNIEWIKPYVVKVILRPEMAKDKELPGITGYYYLVKEQKVVPLQ